MKKLWLIAVLLVGIAAVFLVLKGWPSTTNSNIVVPDGWYLHTTGSNSFILTRQPELPDIGATEGLAYGEQITITTVVMDQPYEQWVASRIPEDDPTYAMKERGMLEGYPTLKVEHETLAAGKSLDYYLFVGERAHVFSLYPVESYDADGKATRNTANIRTLEQLVKDYAARL